MKQFPKSKASQAFYKESDLLNLNINALGHHEKFVENELGFAQKLDDHFNSSVADKNGHQGALNF